MKRVIWVILFAICIGILVFPMGGAQASEDFLVILYNIGSADAILVKSGDVAVMIDAGMDKDGPGLVEALKQEGVEKLDAFIITHFDKDHIGGADAILSAIPVEQVIQPAYEKDSKQYTQYTDALEAAGIKPLTLRSDITIDVEGLPCAFTVAERDYYGEDEENDFSLVTSISYGDTTFLFAGDIENPRLAEMLARGNLTHDFLKVPHHGGYERFSAAFFDAVSPKVAVITSSEDEPEDERVVGMLQQGGAQVYLTREGTVRVTSDGNDITVAPR